jgi:hypothetical protein
MKPDKTVFVQLNVVEDRLHMALSGALWFPIWLSWDEDSFPGPRWDDIGVDIISAITTYLIQMPSQERQVVQFPDGPYRIILGPSDEVSVFIRMESSRMETTDGIAYTELRADLRKFLNSTTLCATRVLDKCIQNGWSGDRVDELRQAVDALNRYKNSRKASGF